MTKKRKGRTGGAANVEANKKQASQRVKKKIASPAYQEKRWKRRHRLDQEYKRFSLEKNRVRKDPSALPDDWDSMPTQAEIHGSPVESPQPALPSLPEPVPQNADRKTRKQSEIMKRTGEIVSR